MIAAEKRAEIRRLFVEEGWPKGSIARHLGIHHGTVGRVLKRSGLAVEPPRAKRPSMLDRFLPWLLETLERYPRATASRLYEMALRRGYPGGPDHFRHRLAELGLRPRRPPEAFFVLQTLPGEQAQVDWADFGVRRVAGGTRRLLAFVMVLSYSRRLFVRFFYDMRLPSFLAGHVLGFDFFGGLVRTVLYDNLKTAVLERRGDAIRFHPRLLELADFYGFEPRPVAPRRGNEKGRVERAIRYLRSSFFALRQEHDLETLNREALDWCRGLASQRGWPQDRRRTVEQAYREEKGSLRPLPNEPFCCHEEIFAQVRRSPYVAFDVNRYSIPHDRIDRTLTVHADLERIRIFDRGEPVAEHPRSWGKNQVIECPEHLAALAREKQKARLHRGQDRLIRALPSGATLLRALAERGRPLQGAVDRLLRLLDEHGPRELEAAVAESLAQGSPHPETVLLILDRRRHERSLPPPLPVVLPDDPKVRDLVVTPHDLADYDLVDDLRDDPDDDPPQEES